MKKIALTSMAILFLVGTFVSCNSNICPAYVMEKPAVEKPLQAENNS